MNPSLSQAARSTMPMTVQDNRPSGKRIAYLVNCFPSFIETMIYREVIELRRRGEDITIFSIRRPKQSEVPREAEGLVPDTRYILPIGVATLVAAHARALLGQPLRYVKILAQVLTAPHSRPRDHFRTLCHFVEAVTLLDEVKRLRIEHIHAHWAVGSATCAMVIARFLDLPFSFTAHAYDIWRDRLLLPEKLQAAKFVVTCTDYNRRHLAETYNVPLDRLRVVYHGIDMSRFPAGRRPRRSAAVLLAVGRLVEQKGLDRLIHASALLTRRGYEFRCEIVGDGPLRGELQRLAQELGVADRVHLVGSKFQEELLDYFAHSDMFVLPCIPASDNDRDGIPNTLIEAMALEVPVISTRFSGIPELVTHGEHGLLVEPSDVTGLADAIAHLLDNPERAREMGTAGRRRIVNDFTVEASGARLQALFASFPEDLVEQPGRLPLQAAGLVSVEPVRGNQP